MMRAWDGIVCNNEHGTAEADMTIDTIFVLAIDDNPQLHPLKISKPSSYSLQPPIPRTLS